MTTSRCWGFVILGVVIGFIFGSLLSSAAPSREELENAKKKISYLEIKRNLLEDELEEAKSENHRLTGVLRELGDELIAGAKEETRRQKEYTMKMIELAKEFKGERVSLVDLKGVNVKTVLGSLGEGMYGLSEQALQNDTELLLRQNGIKVLSEKECIETMGQPCLVVHVWQMRNHGLSFGRADIDIYLYQTVSLLREPAIICAAMTWHKSGTEFFEVNKGNFKEVRQKLKDYVNVFINDYLAANPKESSIKREEKKLKDD